MFRSTLSRGVSAGALTLALTSFAAAQQSLPTIDVGAARPQRQGSARPAPSGGAPSTMASPSTTASPAPGSLAYRLSTPRAQGYVVTSATTGTKDNTPIMQAPMSVKVIPQAVLEDRKITNLREALESVSGVQSNQSIGGGTGFVIRGFSDGSKLFRNGLLATSTGGLRTEFDAANVERIEVLKGPAAMLYGRFEPGGLINIITKRPIFGLTQHIVEQRIGSYDQYRTLWDGAGPVTADGSVAYRFSGGYENNRTFRDFQHIDRMVFNPSVAFRPTPDTNFVVDFEYFNQDFIADYGIPVVYNRPAPIPISRSFGDPNDPRDNMHSFRVASELTHQFNEHLAFRNRFLASFLHTNNNFLNPAPAFLGNSLLPPFFGTTALLANGTLRRNVYGQISDGEVYTTNLDLLGNFDILGMHHETLVGFDYLRAETEYSTFGNFLAPSPLFNINIYAPVYGVPRWFFDAAPYTRANFGRDRSVFFEDQKGAYFQDHIVIWDKLHIFGGGRYDWSQVARGRAGSLSEARAQLDLAYPSIIRRDEAFSPRVGLLFQPLPWLSGYGSWTTSFGANNGVDINNQPLPPQKGEQTEVGLKGEFFDQRLLATFALYHLSRSNLPTRDFSSPDPAVQRAIGEQRSKGVEFDVTGKATDSLSVIGSFSYMDARVIKDNTIDNATGLYTFLGRRLPGAPRYSGSMWFKWDVKELEQLDGLSLGFGVYVVGNRQGDNRSTFQLPGYARLDAMAAYRWNIGPSKVTAQLNIRNLNNVRYFENADPSSNVNPRYGVYPGAPLTAIGSVKVEF